MTGELRPGSGRAKRTENFADVAARAGEFCPRAFARLDLDRAAMQGTPELSAPARCLLGFYLTHLSAPDLERGRTSVWPGNTNAAEALGLSVSSVRRLKGELEQAGLLMRNYDKRNRPLTDDAIDLAPFLSRVPEFLHAVDERAAARRRIAQDARDADDATAGAKTSAVALKFERLKTPQKSSESCQGVSIEEDQPLAEPPAPVPPAPESRGDSSEQEALSDALALSPKLRSALAPEGEGITVELARERISLALPTLFPRGEARSIGHTLLWCWQRHGASALVRLAVAIEDPKIKDPERYFGWLSTTTEAIDLSAQIARIRAKNPAPIRPQLPEDDFGRKAALAIIRGIGAAAYNSWLRPDETSYRQAKGRTGGDILVIETNSEFRRREVIVRFERRLREAAAELGLNGVDVALQCAAP